MLSSLQRDAQRDVFCLDTRWLGQNALFPSPGLVPFHFPILYSVFVPVILFSASFPPLPSMSSSSCPHSLSSLFTCLPPRLYSFLAFLALSPIPALPQGGLRDQLPSFPHFSIMSLQVHSGRQELADRQRHTAKESQPGKTFIHCPTPTKRQMRTASVAKAYRAFSPAETEGKRQENELTQPTPAPGESIIPPKLR